MQMRFLQKQKTLLSRVENRVLKINVKREAQMISNRSLDENRFLHRRKTFHLYGIMAGLLGGLCPLSPTFFSFLDERKEGKRKSRR